MNKNENSSEINPDGALNEVFNSDAGSEKVSANQNRAAWQLDPNTLETANVQLWSRSGTMRGVIPADVAKRYVSAGTCFVICGQAIEEVA